MAFRFSRKNAPKKVEKIRLRKGDLVEVISGKDRSKRGKILEVNRATGRVIVQGVSMIKRHTRKNQANPQGAIIEREGSVHVSNLMLAERFDARAAKRGAQPVKA